MTVSELRKILVGVPGKAQIILSRDEEGNSYHFLYDINLLKFIENEYIGALSSKETNFVLLWPGHEEV